ncbi:acyl-CoA dehydrogenase family protein [Alteribacter natronophilus]|uniref:acyl-CoA dehydrogenase family protein n=1 Tax=Alteribacter natronophilus TaxID=2583810 RepID=UPI00110D56B4|nr:acyl-CoA dehydrogenase family protein [Alteribacter natronophilus]TMW71578.1 hypothetical protein FGB90_11110 [Alteribacter natronophilus]
MSHWIFSEEHDMFRSSFKKMIRNEIESRIENWEEDQLIPKWFIARLSELGLTGMTPDREKSMDEVMEAVLMEELAKTGAAGPALVLQEHNNAVSLLDRTNKSKLVPDFLSAALEGKRIGTTVAADPGDMTVKIKEGFFNLNGRLKNVRNGGMADFLILSFFDDDKSGFITVDFASEGITVQKTENMLGWRSSSVSEVEFRNVKISTENLLCQGDEAEKQRRLINDQKRITWSLICTGIAEKALEAAVSYSRTRQQFGSALSEFQSLRHKMADMALNLEKSRNMTYRAVYDSIYNIDSFQRQIVLEEAVSMALHVCDEALQIHGGAGYMMEFPVQRFWRDTKMFDLHLNNIPAEKVVMSL